MNMLRKTTFKQFLRYTETVAASVPNKLIAEPLSERALIRVQGEEVVPFLQGLITNDMNHLHKDKNPSMFTMFLNKNGRVLYDSIVYRTPSDDEFLIECDSKVSEELRRHLRLYRVRRKIQIDCVNADFQPWVVFNPDEGGELPKPSITLDETIRSPDPRFKELGLRLIQPKSVQIGDVAKIYPHTKVEEATSTDYNTHRYSFGVGEGIIDHPPGKCFPLEANCDFLHGVSFHKGCYVGQELTARVYHTGVIRKRLMPLKLTSELDANSTQVQTQDGAAVGAVRGVSQKLALALLRVEPALKAQDLIIDGKPCRVFKPHWWPKVLPTRQDLRTEGE